MFWFENGTQILIEMVRSQEFVSSSFNINQLVDLWWENTEPERWNHLLDNLADNVDGQVILSPLKAQTLISSLTLSKYIDLMGCALKEHFSNRASCSWDSFSNWNSDSSS